MRITGTLAHLNNKKNAYITKQLKPYGISHGQAITLNIIGQSEKISQDELVKRIQCDKSAITRILASLEDKQYIVKTKSPMNRKYHDITLTAKGEELYSIVCVVLDQTVEKLFAGFHQDEKLLFENMLEKMERNIEDE